jgi:hypothetical protein
MADQDKLPQVRTPFLAANFRSHQATDLSCFSVDHIDAGLDEGGECLRHFATNLFEVAAKSAHVRCLPKP